MRKLFILLLFVGCGTPDEILDSNCEVNQIGEGIYEIEPIDLGPIELYASAAGNELVVGFITKVDTISFDVVEPFKIGDAVLQNMAYHSPVGPHVNIAATIYLDTDKALINQLKTANTVEVLTDKGWLKYDVPKFAERLNCML